MTAIVDVCEVGDLTVCHHIHTAEALIRAEWAGMGAQQRDEAGGWDVFYTAMTDPGAPGERDRHDRADRTAP